MLDLDTLDRKILYELDRDSRQTYSNLGKKTRAKKDTVKYRIQKMMDEGLIEGFFTVIDYAKLGYTSLRYYIEIANASPQIKEEIIQYIKNNKQVWLLFEITGPFHLSFNVWARHIWEHEKFWEELSEKFGIYFAKHHVSIKTRYTEFSRSYLANTEEGKKEFSILQKEKKEDIDDVDFEILKNISVNARVSLVEMAQKTKLSVVTCRMHLKQLIKKKIIIGFRVMFNYEKLGYQYYKVDLWFKDPEKKMQLMQRILSHENVIYTEKTLVTSDFEFDLEVKNFDEFIRIMNGFENQFPNSIKKYEYYTLIKNHKMNYVPSV